MDFVDAMDAMDGRKVHVVHEVHIVQHMMIRPQGASRLRQNVAKRWYFLWLNGTRMLIIVSVGAGGLRCLLVRQSDLGETTGGRGGRRQKAIRPSRHFEQRIISNPSQTTQIGGLPR